jgi:hypothetical protein
MSGSLPAEKFHVQFLAAVAAMRRALSWLSSWAPIAGPAFLELDTRPLWLRTVERFARNRQTIAAERQGGALVLFQWAERSLRSSPT